MRIGSRVSASIETLASTANPTLYAGKVGRRADADAETRFREEALALEWERWIYDCEGHAGK